MYSALRPRNSTLQHPGSPFLKGNHSHMFITFKTVWCFKKLFIDIYRKKPSFAHTIFAPVIYCCITNYTKTEWFKWIIWFLPFMVVRLAFIHGSCSESLMMAGTWGHLEDWDWSWPKYWLVAWASSQHGDWLLRASILPQKAVHDIFINHAPKSNTITSAILLIEAIIDVCHAFKRDGT